MKLALFTFCISGMIGCIPDATSDEESTTSELESVQVSTLEGMQQVNRADIVQSNAWTDCPSGSSCYWDLAGAQGALWKAPSAGWWQLEDVGFRDRISAVWNRGNGAIDFYNCRTHACTVADKMTTVAVGASTNLGADENKADIIFIH